MKTAGIGAKSIVFASWMVGAGAFFMGCDSGDGEASPESLAGEENVAQIESALVGDCSAPTLTVAPSPRVSLGGPVTLSASNVQCMGGVAPQYRFLSGADVLCDWQSTNTCAWSTAGAREGVHELRAVARRHTAGASASAEGRSAVQRYVVGRTCSAVQVAAPSGTPTWTPGSVVAVNAAGSCESGISVEYKLDVFLPGGARITPAWQSSPSWSVPLPADAREGAGRFTIAIRQQGSPVTEATKTGTFWLGENACSAALTATSSGGSVALSAPRERWKCSGGSPVFRFKETSPNGTVTTLQEFAANDSLLIPFDGRSGTYRYTLETRGAETPNQVPVAATTTLKIAATCTGASVTTVATAEVGSTVVLGAAAAGCLPEFTYRYRATTSKAWIPIDCAGGTTKPASPWAGGGCSWNTTGLTPGEYKLSVVARTQGATAVASEATSAEASTFLDSVDADGDGYTTSTGDCWEGNASVHPGVRDVAGDGIDNDCDGAIDNVPPGPVEAWAIGYTDQKSLHLGLKVERDSSDNLYLTRRLPRDPNDANSNDTVLQKLDPSGNVLWTRQFAATYYGTTTPPRNTTPSAIYVDAGNNVYVGGYTEGTFSTNPSDAGNGRSFIRKYDSAGTLQWTYTGSGQWSIAQIALDQVGNIYFRDASAIYMLSSARTFLWGYGVVTAGTLSQLVVSPSGGVFGMSSDGVFRMKSPPPDTSPTKIEWARWGSSVEPSRGPSPGSKARCMAWNPHTETIDLVADDNLASLDPANGSTVSGPTTLWGTFPNSTQKCVMDVDAAGQVLIASYVGASSSLPGHTVQGVNDMFFGLVDASRVPQWAHQFGTTESDDVPSIAAGSSSLYLAGSHLNSSTFRYRATAYRFTW